MRPQPNRGDRDRRRPLGRRVSCRDPTAWLAESRLPPDVRGALLGALPEKLRQGRDVLRSGPMTPEGAPGSNENSGTSGDQTPSFRQTERFGALNRTIPDRNQMRRLRERFRQRSARRRDSRGAAR